MRSGTTPGSSSAWCGTLDSLFGLGAEDRTVIYLGAGLDTQPGVSPGGRGPEHIRCERERLAEVVLALRALLAGAALNARTVAGIKTAVLASSSSGCAARVTG